MLFLLELILCIIYLVFTIFLLWINHINPTLCASICDAFWLFSCLFLWRSPLEERWPSHQSVLILYYCFPLSVATSWDDLRRFCLYGSDIDVNIRKMRKFHKSNFKLIIIIFLNSNLNYECDTLVIHVLETHFLMKTCIDKQTEI